MTKPTKAKLVLEDGTAVDSPYLQDILDEIQRADTPELRAAYAKGKMADISADEWWWEPEPDGSVL